MKLVQTTNLLNRLRHRKITELRPRRRWAIPKMIHKYFIPRSVFDGTMDLILQYGNEQRECYIWWGGYFTLNGYGQVLTALCADVPTEFGRVYLSYRELLKLSAELRERDQLLLIELHSHPPGAGGQNEVDAAHPAATYKGFTSVVVPDFGNGIMKNLDGTYVYEYLGSCEWKQLDQLEVTARFLIEDTVIVTR